MLHTVTGAIYVDVEVAYVVFWIGKFHGPAKLEHACEGLPWVFALEPVQVVLGVFGYSMDSLYYRLGKLSPVIERELILSEFVGQVNFEPV
jgi:hypothetical protein